MRHSYPLSKVCQDRPQVAPPIIGLFVMAAVSTAQTVVPVDRSDR